MEADKSKASYGVGMSIAESLAQQDLNTLDLDQVLAGMRAIFNGETPLVTPEEANQHIQRYLDAQKTQKYEVNKLAGEAFLADNAQRPEVKTTASGLQYEVLQEGDGPKPGPTSQVTVHYHGTLIDGTVFDSSVERGSPATFGVNQVIRGWTEALQLMSAGSKYRLSIPQELAYGANPHPGGAIQPYAALVFDVELLSIA
ncbi:MAG: FKBP-type peptidyl-prolyl cis-trans isomerase [Crocinitomicaceae bacterium]|jgi:FKBP-type peptidyl-prolyl cis-trans isomerase|nr:FKBP-type peptidyl-prolyl cis-trans isomerase [Crocinitomicaceae bacterium]MDP4724001.1 FKBP-type peptidyl-prolyl cis-trans isomerase [Crocinitomicaceae bacterium]MDP4739318.1 FKBP-type peptidyl-prolyl cis-trans isomerase [Crocinitomicaceae bacterium]MDP4798527.1 FKBP-type peptidyl-prolyl cis-trans isomerase [Crocinitomicaceae bacterium]MDP4807000.1 FKBP-type peptidyl-prolyl cis-trans isomerase [Crocinitomicaceae bacterium]